MRSLRPLPRSAGSLMRRATALSPRRSPVPELSRRAVTRGFVLPKITGLPTEELAPHATLQQVETWVPPWWSIPKPKSRYFSQFVEARRGGVHHLFAAPVGHAEHHVRSLESVAGVGDDLRPKARLERRLVGQRFEVRQSIMRQGHRRPRSRSGQSNH